MLRPAGLLLAIAAIHAQPPCANCHPREAERHAATNHANTLRRPATSAFARNLPDAPLGEARGGFLLTYRQTGDTLTIRAARGKAEAEGRIEWILGAGDQGETPLVNIAGRWLEHRISFYTKPQRYDLTLGHQPGISRSPEHALGIPQSESTIRQCLACHGERPPGLTCGNCHANTSNHPAQPTRKPALEQCAECHRLTPPGKADDPLNIRFQPLRLVKSACYTKGQITCTTCHPPHANALRANPTFYREKCRQCHQSTHATEPRDCLPCHMPKSSPAPYLEFTDHHIRRNQGK
ncbi:MAG: hypothetical protein HYX27_05075 [Acidobacteria bacterium]|nr:hypothetical protein [Acidobacteriota bacterium]